MAIEIWLGAVRLKNAKDYPEGECSAYRCKKPSSTGLQGATITRAGEPQTRDLRLCDYHWDKYMDGKTAAAPVAQVEPQVEPLSPEEERDRLDLVLGVGDGSPPEILRKEALPEASNDTRIALSQETKDLEEGLKLIREYEIETEADATFAIECRADLKAQLEALEERRKKATGPLNASLREINSWFKPARDAAQAAISAWNEKLKTLAAAKAQAQEILQDEARQAFEGGNMEEVRSAMIAAGEATKKPEGITYVDHWRFEVEDASKVPREFLAVDATKVAAVVRALKGETRIPGIRVWNDPTVKSTPGSK